MSASYTIPSFNGAQPNAAKLLPEGTSVYCIVDGIEQHCSSVGGEAAVQCPDNNCGSPMKSFHAYSDGYSRYLAAGLSYVGDGFIIDGRKEAFDDVEYGLLSEGLRAYLLSPSGQKEKQKQTKQRVPSTTDLPLRGPHKPDSWTKAVDKAFNRVEGILKNNPNSACALFFGPDALTVLEAMRQTPPTIRPKTDSPGATATGIRQTYGQLGKFGFYRLPTEFLVFQNGPFFAGERVFSAPGWQVPMELKTLRFSMSLLTTSCEMESI